MLIDAAHPEETRVVVVNNGQLEDFEFESSTKKQLKGNIYLAKVTRVEPSLQAAFVDYGGNRHGFLAFSEIHPDYYQVPQADRRELDEAERQVAAGEGNGAAEEADDGASEAVATTLRRRRRRFSTSRPGGARGCCAATRSRR
jgi:ribonuclease E